MSAEVAEKGALTQPTPYGVDLEEGRTYWYCQCGLSKTQPFCDGSHSKSSTGLKPLKFVAEKTEKHWLCACRQSDSLPFCDGQHRKEKGLKKYNEFLLKKNTELKEEQKKLVIKGAVGALTGLSAGLLLAYFLLKKN